MLSADIYKDGTATQEGLKAFLDEKCAFYNDAFDNMEAARKAQGARAISDVEQLDDQVRQPPGFSPQIFKILLDKLHLRDDKVVIEEFIRTYLEGEYRLLERSK